MRQRSCTIQAESIEEFIDLSVSKGLEMENLYRSQMENPYRTPLFNYYEPNYDDSHYSNGKKFFEEENGGWPDSNNGDASTPSTQPNSLTEEEGELFKETSSFRSSALFAPPTKPTIVKTMIIGTSGTGKHLLVNRMFDTIENEGEKVKNGFDLMIRNKQDFKETKTYKIWTQDPSSQYIDALLQVYYKSIPYYVFLYRIDDRRSFEILDQVINHVKSKVGNKFRGLLIGGASNQGFARRVNPEEGENLRAKYQLESFVEDSYPFEGLKTTFFQFSS